VDCDIYLRFSPAIFSHDFFNARERRKDAHANVMMDGLEIQPGRTFADEIVEARMMQATGNIGRARTCARRAVGMLLREKIGIGPGPHHYAPTFILGLRKLASDSAIPDEVRIAAGRLVDRSRPDRTSASAHPVQDAEIIFRHFGVE
jgi:hypothetical protein